MRRKPRLTRDFGAKSPAVVSGGESIDSSRR
jgi:hypothetical protein